MKTVALFLACFIAGFSIMAQETDDLVSVGDIMNIGTPENGSYRHIHFPKKNFIIKRGGLADMKSVQGNEVVVTHIKTIKEGTTVVTLERKNGRKFFKYLPSVKADLENALANGELKIPVSSKEGEIARR